MNFHLFSLYFIFIVGFDTKQVNGFVFFIFTGKIYARGVETINWGNTFYIWF